jgi:beta-galactosidase
MERRKFLKVAGVAAGAALARPGSAATAAPVTSPPLTASGPGERLSLDLGWRFHRGDIAAPVPHTGDESYAATKAGAAGGAAALFYNDSAWRQLDLPHDFVVEGPFEETANVAPCTSTPPTRASTWSCSSTAWRSTPPSGSTATSWRTAGAPIPRSTST